MNASPEQIKQWSDSIMEEIAYDVSDGIVPDDIESFSALHDHVDANDYATQVVPQGDLSWDDYLELLNTVESEVDRRLKARAAM
jgi:hypothetical protein